MNHEERVQTANKLTKMMLKKCGDDILLGGIFGSTARGTDTEFSDLEMLFVVRDESKAKSFDFAYKDMPVTVVVQKVSDVQKDITEVELEWPLKMGRLFNLKITCGDHAILKRFRKLLESVPQNRFHQCIAKETPLCYEGLGRLKAVKIRGNTHETGLFVFEILFEFTLLTAIFNREFINHDYLGGLNEAYRFKELPEAFEENAKKLLNWPNTNIDDVINVAEEFVQNFVALANKNGIKLEEHDSLEKLPM